MPNQLYNQPLVHRLGNELIGLLLSGTVRSFEFAVAWVRRSGTSQLTPAILEHLKNGGAVKGTVGIDIENTSIEGLEDLLSWEDAGAAEFYVYHDENPATTFHPKAYFLKSDDEATLIVGSNNLTESGLYLNTEASLQVSERAGSTLLRQAESMLESWRDNSNDLIKRLDSQLLSDLEKQGYVMREEVLRVRRKTSEATGRSRRQGVKLFGSTKVARPKAKRPPQRVSGADEGAVLLMRVRRASERERRTQIQIPIRVRRSPFFASINKVRSGHTGDLHGMHEAKARKSVNTIKLEIPEIESFPDPVMRFERTAGEVTYSAFDATSSAGRQIMRALKEGRNAAISPTVLTTPSRPLSATWWRFV